LFKIKYVFCFDKVKVKQYLNGIFKFFIVLFSLSDGVRLRFLIMIKLCSSVMNILLKWFKVIFLKVAKIAETSVSGHNCMCSI